MKRIGKKADLEKAKEDIFNLVFNNVRCTKDCVYDYLLLKSPDGCVWKLYIDNDGRVLTEKLYCPYDYDITGGIDVSNYLPDYDYDQNYWYYFCTWCQTYYYQYGVYPDPNCIQCL